MTVAVPPGAFPPVAVIGMAVRLPDADTLDELHDALRKGVDSVRPVPRHRLEMAGLDPHASYPPMALLSGIETFDRDYFGLTPAEAVAMDPHHRLTLQLTCAAVENAGLRVSALDGSRTGVFLSAPRPDYVRFVGEDDLVTMLGTASPALAGRIAYLLGLQGPALVVETGCSSSLVALRHACLELAAGSVDLALAGGLSLQLLPMRAAEVEGFPEVMAADGRCRAFDAAAGGTCQGEGGAILLLKPFDRAVADGDVVHGVIRAVAVNHNGTRSTGFSAPGPAAQVEVLAEAWAQAGRDPRDLAALEGHGSGTRLGDMIEIAAAQRVLSAAGAAAQTCALGSVKSNVGHLDHAAGILGLVKSLLAVRHRTVYASLHVDTPNPQLAGGGPLRVATATRGWDGPGPMLAAVSSFSLTGTNVHAVVEEAAQRPATDGPVRPDIATVSARTPDALRRYLRAVRSWAATLDATDLPAAVQTLNAGRDDHAYRVAFPVSSLRELQEGLDDAVDRVPAAARGARRLVLAVGAPDAPAGDAFHAVPTYQPVEDAAVDPALRHQHAVGRLLDSIGVSADVVLGVGTRAVARALRGDAPLEPDRPSPVDPDRLAGVVVDVTAAGPTVCATLGTVHPALPAAFTEPHRVVALDPSDPVRLMGSLAALYEAGVAIDWERWYAGDVRRRIEAPTYPFEPTVCWPATPPSGAQQPARVEAAPATTEPAGADADVAAEIVAIWRDVLQLPDVTEDADYFEIGGNSILGLAVLNRINRRFGARLALPQLYEHSSVSDLATLVRAQVATATAAAAGIPRLPDHSGPKLPSHGQEALWFLNRLMPDVALYNVPVDLHIAGELDVDAMRAALTGMLARHEILRARYVEVDGEPRVVLRPLGDSELEVVDLGHLPAPDRLAEAESLLRRIAGAPMDLTTGPLLRTVLVRLAPDDHILLLVAHHSVYDGWTPAILDRDLWELYAAAVERREPNLPALPVGYPDVAAWQRARLAGDYRDRLLDYWRARLAGARPVTLPSTRPRPRRLSGRGAHYYFTIPAELLAGLRRLSSAERVTPFVTMLTLLKTVLARYTDQHDVVVGTTTAGRHHPDVLDLIGYFNNAVPLRSDLSGDPTFREALATVRDTVVGAIAHDELPFAALVAEVQPERDLSRHPIFQVTYVHQNLPENARDIGPGLRYHPEREEIFAGLPPDTSKWDLNVAVWEYDGRATLPAVIEYSVDLYDGEQIAELADALVTLLAGVVADPGLPLSAYPLAPTDRPARALYGPPLPAGDATLATALGRWASDDPLAPAPGGRSVAELSADVAAVATRVRGLISAGDRVAVLLDQPDAVVAVLAIAAAGGVTVALDPDESFAGNAARLEAASPALLLARGDRPLPWPGPVLLVGQEPAGDAAALPDATASTPPDATASTQPAGADAPAALIGGVEVTHAELLATAAQPGAVPAVEIARGDDLPVAVAGWLLRRGAPIASDAAMLRVPLPVAALSQAADPDWRRIDELAPGVRLDVRDAAGRPTPVAVVGELYIGDRRTGERARWTAAGELEILRAGGADAGQRSAPAAERPAGPLEAAIAAMFTDVLGRQVGRHDSFFVVGGHSLLVTRLLAAVRTRYGVRIPVSAVFDAPSVAALAVAVREAGGDETGPLVPVRAGGSAAPLYSIPPLYYVGDPGDAYLLAQRLPPGRPVYAVTGDGDSVADSMAALRDRQPDAPYTLTGHADELAERLRAAGLDARVLAESALDGALDGAPLDRAVGSAGTASALDGAAISGPWRDLLRGAPRLELPADRSPSAPGGGAVTTRPFRFTADESRALGAGTREDAAYVATVVALLARFSGEPDVVVGVRLGRTAALVPIRVRTGDDPPFAELRRRVTDAIAAAERLAPPEPAAGDAPGRPHPLLSAAIEFDAAGAPSLATPAGRVDVLWRIRLDGDAVSGSLTCDGDRFRPRTAKRITDRWRRLVAAVAADGTRPVTADALMDADERDRVLREARGDEVAGEQGATLVSLVRRQVAATPAAVAVVDGDRRLSYAELDVAARRLAGALRSAGARPESVVGVGVQRSADLVVALLGVLYAGAAYLPLDLDSPPERIAFVLADAGVRLVVRGSAPLPLPDGVTAVDVTGGEEIEPVDVVAGTAAYVIYTSGSTGRPKGVVVPHAGIANRIEWAQARNPLGPADRVLQKTPATFDVSVWEFFWPLVSGAAVAVAPPGAHRDAFHLADLIARERVTVTHFVPSMLREFLAAVGPAALGGVRLLVSSGEALPPEIARAVTDGTTAEILNLYGPTEASVDVSVWDCRQASPTATVPIGRPVPGTGLYVLDADLRPCPTGVPGTLYIAGAQLARGYLGRPGLTAERFVPSPYGAPGERLYDTGDRCRVVDGGVLEYLGRVDDQVKIRGVRIEPGEVEAVLLAHPDVTVAAVAAVETRPGDEELVAYLTGSPAAEPDIRAFLSARLPMSMVPTSFVWLADVPLTASGKLDRRNLPAMSTRREESTG